MSTTRVFVNIFFVLVLSIVSPQPVATGVQPLGLVIAGFLFLLGIRGNKLRSILSTVVFYFLPRQDWFSSMLKLTASISSQYERRSVHWLLLVFYTPRYFGHRVSLKLLPAARFVCHFWRITFPRFGSCWNGILALGFTQPLPRRFGLLLGLLPGFQR